MLEIPAYSSACSCHRQTTGRYALLVQPFEECGRTPISWYIEVACINCIDGFHYFYQALVLLRHVLAVGTSMGKFWFLIVSGYTDVLGS